jgi:uncharacterized protein (DUF1684 family)
MQEKKRWACLLAALVIFGSVLPGQDPGLEYRHAVEQWREGHERSLGEDSGSSAVPALVWPGLHWYPPKESFRITAAFVAHDPPRRVRMATTAGEVERYSSPGYVVFALEGRELRLTPVEVPGREGELFFVFRDQTSGKETHDGGRFLYADFPRDGRVVLDVNKAMSPPCAIAPHDNCLLPPAHNNLAVRIEAGERTPREGT